MSMLDHDQRAVCARAVEFYGRRAQLLKVAEELIELADECRLAAVGYGNADHLALERADVEVVLYQFDNLLLPSLALAVRDKINSQVERLERRLNDE